MNFYVAGKWEERAEVKKLMNILKSKGHEITMDWTVHEHADDGYPEQYSVDDIEGVEKAEAFVGLFINPNSYKGALVELGVALTRCDMVYIIGHAVDSCIFINPAMVDQFDTIEDFLLKGLK